MNKNTTVALFGSVFVGAVILLALTGTNPVVQAIATTPTTISDNNVGIFGHITLTLTDENGNIKAYQQLDNTIGQTGSDCIMSKMFGTTSGTEFCANDANDFNFIEIGTLGNAGVTGDCSGVQPDSTVDQLFGPVSATGVDKILATTILAAPAAGSGSVVTLSAAFNPTGATVIINEALLSNIITTNTGDTMANQCFTPITVTSSDTLTVEWVITVTTA